MGFGGFGPAQGTFGGNATFTNLTITGTATFASTVTVTTSISSPLYTSAANAAIAVSPGDNASATDTAGADVNVRSGKGRGAGAASSIVFQTPTVGASGTTLQSLATRLTVATAGITATVPVIHPAGTTAAPSVAVGEAGSGLYLVATRRVVMTTGGVSVAEFGDNGGNYLRLAACKIDFSANLNGGDVALRRIAAGIVGLDTSTAAAGATLEMYEQTAPAAGAANSARIFAVDSGGGKTVLKVQFATGAAQVLATEP